MFSAIADGFGYLYRWLQDLFTWLMNGLLNLLQPLLDLLGFIFYFIYMIGYIIVKVITVVLMIGKLLIGITVGLFKTITGLGMVGTAGVMPTSYSNAFLKLQPLFAQMQIDKVAYVIHFTIWLSAAFIAMRIIGRMREGN